MTDRLARALWLLAALAPFALGACTAPVESRPFTEFSLAVRDLRAGTDALLEENATRARERILTGVEDGLVSDDLETVAEVLDGLRISFEPGDPFGGSAAALPHHAAGRFRGDVRALNDQMVRYADLLLRLARAAPVGEGEVDSLATSVNVATRRALEGLGVERAPEIGGLFATAATAAFREYLRSHQREHLERALAENHGAVQDFARHLRQACEIAALDLRQTYLARYDRLQDALIAARGTTALRPQLEELLAFNDWFTEAMAALREVDQGYELLPAAHYDLLVSLRDERSTTGSIRYLAEQGRQMYERYRRLASVPEPAPGEGGPP